MDAFRNAIETRKGVPVVPLEDAIRFLCRLQAQFPEWKGLVLPYDAVIAETFQAAYGAWKQYIRGQLGITPEQEEGYLSRIFATKIQLYEQSPVPDLDMLRQQTPEGSDQRMQLELDMAYTRLRVGEVLKPVHRKAFSPIGYGEPFRKLEEFRGQLMEAMTAMGITCQPVRIKVAEVRGGRVISIETHEGGGST